MEEEANEVGLRINEEKTKYTINTRNKIVLGMRNIYKYITMNLKVSESLST